MNFLGTAWLPRLIGHTQLVKGGSTPLATRQGNSMPMVHPAQPMSGHCVYLCLFWRTRYSTSPFKFTFPPFVPCISSKDFLIRCRTVCGYSGSSGGLNGYRVPLRHSASQSQITSWWSFGRPWTCPCLTTACFGLLAPWLTSVSFVLRSSPSLA